MVDLDRMGVKTKAKSVRFGKVEVMVPKSFESKMPTPTYEFKPSPVSPGFKLTNFPIAVVENIFEYLDGPSVLILREMSPQMAAFVDEVLTGRIGRKFWLIRCFAEAPRVQVIRCLDSYVSTIEAYRRNICEEVGIDAQSISNQKWRYVYTSLYKLRQRFNGAFQVIRLTDVQTQLKNEVIMTFKEKARRATYPIKMVSTSGSTLFYIQCPCSSLGDQEHLYVFENMKTYRRGVQILENRDKVRTVRVVNLPIPLQPSDFPQALPPKPPVLVIITTKLSIVLAPLHQGQVLRVLPRPNPMYGRFPHLELEHRYAIWGDKLAVWTEPGIIIIFIVKIDPVIGDVSTNLVKKVVLQNDELFGVWQTCHDDPMAYLPALRLKFRNPYVTSPSEMPIMCFISPVTTSYEIHFGETTANREIIADVQNFYPKMTPAHNVSLSLQMGKFTGKLVEQNMCVFWNASWLAVLYCNPGHMWIYQDLTTTLFVDPANEKLIHVECQTQNFFIFATNLNIYVCLLTYVSPSLVYGFRMSRICTRGHIEFETVRRIPLTSVLPNPDLLVTHIHYDMDHGKPYIFLACDLPMPQRTAYSYELLKYEYVATDEDLEEEFGHLKLEEDPWTMECADNSVLIKH